MHCKSLWINDYNNNINNNNKKETGVSHVISLFFLFVLVITYYVCTSLYPNLGLLDTAWPYAITGGTSQFNMMFGTKHHPWDNAMCLLQDELFMGMSTLSPAKDYL